MPRRYLCLSLIALLSSASAPLVWGAPAKKPAPAAKKPAASNASPAAATAPAPKEKPTSGVKQTKEGEFEAVSQGVSKQKMTVGKIDPPAAFNLEDIQNFPEDRLHPVLNNPITFEEGRDFSTMMDSLDDKVVHPWLPEIPTVPFLTMKVALDKPVKDWRFSVIDQGGTPVASKDGKGTPPAVFTWEGDDKDRGYIAVDTVYIPQLSTTDKDGYRRTYMGHPSQFAAFMRNDKGRSIIEVSTKRLFLENKSDFTKEAEVYLEKICDLVRQSAKLPFSVQAFDSDSDLGRDRTSALQKYFAERLMIPPSQISTLEPMAAKNRGLSVAITINGTPGGSN